MSASVAATPPPSALDVLVVRTVRAIEETGGPLDDGDAVRRAATNERTRDARIVARAWALAAPLGLVDDIGRWRTALPWLLGAAALGVALVASGIVGAVTGHDRSLNAVAALLALLGLPSLSLLLWLASLAWRRPPGGGGIARWTVAIAARLPALRSPHGMTLVRCALDGLARARLLPWVLGLANHLVWIGAFVGILLGLLAAFAFRSYTLNWETTILSPGFFAGVIAATGWLPARLGFPVPDVASALAAHAPSGDQRPWAWWLIGCTVVYGLVPRLLGAVLCVAVWRRRRPALAAIDPADPYVRKLDARFARWEEAPVVDAEQPVPLEVRSPMSGEVRPGTRAVVGFELPGALPWPVDGGAAPPGWSASIAGTAAERRDVLDRLAQTRPERVLLVVGAEATPDRGTERFVREALAWGGEGALLLAAGDGADAAPAGAARWCDWLRAIGLGTLRVFVDPRQAQAWADGRADG